MKNPFRRRDPQPQHRPAERTGHRPSPADGESAVVAFDGDQLGLSAADYADIDARLRAAFTDELSRNSVALMTLLRSLVGPGGELGAVTHDADSGTTVVTVGGYQLTLLCPGSAALWDHLRAGQVIATPTLVGATSGPADGTVRFLFAGPGGPVAVAAQQVRVSPAH